jgi:hypothetical protein
MASPNNKRRFDRGPFSTPLPDPLRRRVGNEVGAEVPPVAKAAVPPPAPGPQNQRREHEDAMGMPPSNTKGRGLTETVGRR